MGQGCVHVFVDGKNPLQKQAFYTVGESFVKAEDLKISDKLLLSSGKCVTIEKLEVETLEMAENTYNFEVADFHTYYVSESNVLVHNRCNKEWNNERRRYWRQQAKQYEKPTGRLSKSKTYKVTRKNINRMKRGSAPIGKDGKPVNLHHNKGIAVDFYDYRELTHTDHYSNFKK